ncbi:MAG: RraA family protein [Planctomycetia bacterium]|nr:RraA family protein [Planctomycetia bacterium]
MADPAPPHLSLALLRQHLYTAAISDALDRLGHRAQVCSIDLRPMTGHRKLIGRAKTTLWADMAHDDANPYELELKAVDSCRTDDVLVAAAAGSMRSGLWGELLSTAARNRGCVGAIVDGAVRDVAAMTAMGFAVFARGACPRDSLHRQRVIDVDVPVELGSVRCAPGDLVVADEDGVVIVPAALEREALEAAWSKIDGEHATRAAIAAGMKAWDAYQKFGVL